MKTTRSLAILLVAVSALSLGVARPSVAHAQLALTAGVDGAAGTMLTSRYRDRFDWGGGFDARVGLELVGPLLAVRLAGGASWFPVGGQAPGTLYTIGVGARSTIVVDRVAGGPFVDLDLAFGLTGSLMRFTPSLAVGWSFAPVPELFVGPFARYTVIVQDPSDAVPDPGHLIYFGLDATLRFALGGAPPPPPPPPPPPTVVDTDGDRVPDDEDRCPTEAEDVDGTLDDDGCLDPDNDSDGLRDADDRCPDAAETRNGYEDDDGCPDEAPPPPTTTTTVVVVPHGTPGRPLGPSVHFRVGEARVSPRYHDAITEVCHLALAEPTARLRVIGHADEQGTAAGNQRLGAERAGAVAEQLILCGVAPDRIESVSYGDQRPRCEETSEECRQDRRRVEFEIVEPPAAPSP
jgi:outer membrane protein OmpA-like peptidoglycan-associated protein